MAGSIGSLQVALLASCNGLKDALNTYRRVYGTTDRQQVEQCRKNVSRNNNCKKLQYYVG